jgi:predicted transposase YdaD
LINLELQSTNDLALPLRMAEYALRVYRLYRRFPRQYVLYVGEPELRMTPELAGDDFLCRFTITDIRTLDEEALLKSPFASDAIIAILLRHADRRETIRRILARIAKLESGARELAYAKLLILAGLRKLEETIQTEVERMPILNDIMEHEIIGPAIRQGLLKGRQEGEFIMLRGLIGKRFGPIPPSIEERLSNLSVADLEAISLRLFDAQTLDDLFKP